MRRSSAARPCNDKATTGLGRRGLRTAQAATILIALASAAAALAQPADKVARIGVLVRAGKDLPAAFESAARAGAQAVMTTQAPFFWVHRRQIAELAMRHRLPSLSGETGAADAGVLMTHGPSIPDSCRRAAAFVDRILQGVKPSELPAEQPTKFELVLNLKTARALGLTFPPALVLRADRVIE